MHFLAGIVAVLLKRGLRPMMWAPALIAFLCNKREHAIIATAIAVMATVALDVCFFALIRHKADSATGLIAVAIGSLAYTFIFYRLERFFTAFRRRPQAHS